MPGLFLPVLAFQNSPSAALVVEALLLSHPFTSSSLLIDLLLFPSQGLFTSSSPHPSPVVHGLGIPTLSHSCHLLSECSLSPFSGFCIIEEITCPFSLPAAYFSAFLRCPPKLLAFPPPPPPHESSYLILIFTVTADAAGMGLATFHFYNFPWEIDFPVLFLVLFLCSGHQSPESSSFSSSSLRSSSKGRRLDWSWRLAIQSQSLSKSLPVPCAVEADSGYSPK